MIITILIILAIYVYLYFKPTVDTNNFGDYLLWFNKRIELSPGKFRIERTFVYIRKFKI